MVVLLDEDLSELAAVVVVVIVALAAGVSLNSHSSLLLHDDDLTVGVGDATHKQWLLAPGVELLDSRSLAFVSSKSLLLAFVSQRILT